GQNSLLPEGGLPNFLNKNLSGFLLTKKVSTPLPEGEVSAPATPEIKPETAVTNPQSEVAAATPETKELHQPIQAKLTVGEAGDKYEQEADAVAAQVVEKINSPQLQQPVQRQSDTGVTSVPNITVMRHSEGGTGEGASVTADVEEGIQRARGGGQGLDESVREPMEGAFGADFSGVRVHTGDEAVQMNRELGAQAFTHGSDIYFGEGKSPGNDELTAHELTHVVQQTGAIPTKRVPKQPILNLEREVDQFPERTVTPIAGEQDKMQSLSSAPVGIAKQVIWRHTQDIPENLLLVLDVDDGDFVGGCVKKIVPHVGAKLIKKGVAKGEKNMLFDIHIGFVENEKGEYCIFFYESVSRDCEMQCYPSEEEAYKAWEEIKEWLIDLIKKVLIVLAIAAIAIALAAIAVLIADAIMAALAVLILI
ncbi:MAG TPA: hypothetical protein DDW51_03610, partial [Cyanobacteria bacterium UBA11367]|nr:hypothetical protein [Cyanobacteria bacterium UBA11367]